MAVARTLVAFLIALSVALMPATLGAGRMVTPTDMAMSMDDCCPSSVAPCDKALKDCPFMASCILKSFNFAAQDFARLLPPLTHTTAAAFKPSDALASHRGSPPLHPPQI